MDVMSGFVCLRGTDSLLPVEIIISYLCDWLVHTIMRVVNKSLRSIGWIIKLLRQNSTNIRWEKTQYPEFHSTFDDAAQLPLFPSVSPFSSPSPSTSLSLSPSQSPFYGDHQKQSNYRGLGKASSCFSPKLSSNESISLPQPIIASLTGFKEAHSQRPAMPEQTRDNRGSLGSGEDCDIINVTINAIIANSQREAASRSGLNLSSKTRHNLEVLNSNKTSISNDEKEVIVVEEAELDKKCKNQRSRGGVTIDPTEGIVPSHIKITVAGCQELSISTSAPGCEFSGSRKNMSLCTGFWTRVLRYRGTFCVVLMRQFRLFNRSIGWADKIDCFRTQFLPPSWLKIFSIDWSTVYFFIFILNFCYNLCSIVVNWTLYTTIWTLNILLLEGPSRATAQYCLPSVQLLLCSLAQCKSLGILGEDLQAKWVMDKCRIKMIICLCKWQLHVLLVPHNLLLDILCSSFILGE